MHNFYSDTQTKPSAAMRAAMAEAEVGDEQRGLDPTTNALNERVADLLGKEAAVFLPSGTLCNEIAIAVHCRPGEEIICHRSAHIIAAEGGGPAALSGVMLYPLDSDDGVLDPAQVEGAIRPESRYLPRSRLLSVEQTANLTGGTVWPVATLDAVAETAKSRGLATHMDGARLVNAAIASGEAPAVHARGYDSVWLDLSKGLGCPVGAVLAGSRAFIDEAWRFKQRWGGAMRQSGIIAAAGLYALDHNVERLTDDHDRARRIGRALAQLPGVAGINDIQSNLVFVDLTPEAPDAETLVAELLDEGIMIGAFGPRRLRIVTHLDVGDAAADAVIAALTARLG
ncbi:threonine aldolase family protein [Marinivivus vitaminiproducens]|uniref:threonine aldolase family protein n=1 Tax=Marinivivus vitaminiproducens TaxID=3035935 RepID=UPI0027993DA6|nr:threonine aldolase family protein [Geminicoccaceae bacterium SCSIO 64248]